MKLKLSTQITSLCLALGLLQNVCIASPRTFSYKCEDGYVALFYYSLRSCSEALLRNVWCPKRINQCELKRKLWALIVRQTQLICFTHRLMVCSKEQRAYLNYARRQHQQLRAAFRWCCEPSSGKEPSFLLPLKTQMPYSKKTNQISRTSIFPVSPTALISTPQHKRKVNRINVSKKLPPKTDIFHPILFGYASDVLMVQSKQVLAQYAIRLKRHQTHVLIEGHCDKRGSSSYNFDLGKRRSLSVKNYFVEQGVNPNLITIISYGFQRPVDHRDTEAAFAKNRRVIFRVITNGGAK